MTDHHQLRLRVIVVSTRAALGSLFSTDDAEHVKLRARGLLSDLKTDVLNDGAQPQLLARIEDALTEMRADTVGVGWHATSDRQPSTSAGQAVDRSGQTHSVDH